MEDLRYYLQTKAHSDSSTKRILSEVKQFTLWLESRSMQVGMTTYNDITLFMEHLKNKGNAQRTIAHYINSLTHYYSFCIQEGEALKNYPKQIKVQGTKKNAVYHPIPKEELEYLYNTFPSQEQNLSLEPLSAKDCRDKILLSLLIFQGLTTTDIKQLTTEHINLRQGKIHIPRSKKINARTLKLNPVQVYDMNSYLTQAREELLQLQNQKTDYLIVSYRKGNNTVKNLLQELLPRLKALLPHLQNYRHLRASVIAHWLNEKQLRQTQKMIGHRFISSTEKYQSNDIESLRNEFEKYCPVY